MLYYILYLISIFTIYKYNYIFYFCYYKLKHKKTLHKQIELKNLNKYDDL